MKEVILPYENWRQECWDFAVAVDRTVADCYGKQRGQANRELRITQHYGGKLCECVVSEWLNRQGVTCTSPDFNIYERNQKRFGIDLTVSLDGIPTGLHVKSQTFSQARRFGFSLVFQNGDCAKKNDHVALCFIDERNRVILLRGLPRVTDLHRHGLFKEPKKVAFRGQKKVLYMDDFERYLPEETQWALVYSGFDFLR